MPRTVILVEGASDCAALEALAARQARNLAADGVAIVPMGGATGVAAHVRRLGLDRVRLVGLCDAGEERHFRRAFEGRADAKVFVCHRDLEEELIRALGSADVEAVIDARGDLESLRRMQKQPAQRARTVDAQLHRFLGTRSGRKALYARALVDALDLARVPAPLRGALAAVDHR